MFQYAWFVEAGDLNGWLEKWNFLPKCVTLVKAERDCLVGMSCHVLIHAMHIRFLCCSLKLQPASFLVLKHLQFIMHLSRLKGVLKLRAIMYGSRLQLRWMALCRECTIGTFCFVQVQHCEYKYRLLGQLQGSVHKTYGPHWKPEQWAKSQNSFIWPPGW